MMENSLYCNDPQCQEPASLFCQCLSTREYFCKIHSSNHLFNRPRSDHSIKIFFVPLSPNEQQKVLDIKQKAQIEKKKAILRVLKNFDEQTIEIQNRLKKLEMELKQNIKEIQQKYDLIILQSEKYLSDPGVIGDSQTQNDFLLFVSQYQAKYLFYFENQSKILCKLNLENMQIQRRQISLIQNKMHLYTMCDWKQKEILITGNYYYMNPFILNTQNFNIQSFPQLPCGNIRCGSLIVFDSLLFHFGGRKQSSNQITADCYKFEKNQWKQIQKLPSPSVSMSSIQVGDKIIVTGNNIGQILRYYPSQDRFDVLFEYLLIDKIKQLLLFPKGEIVCFQSLSNSYMCQGQDLKKWIEKESSKDYVWAISQRVQYWDHLYYVNSRGQLLGVNTSTYQKNVVF